MKGEVNNAYDKIKMLSDPIYSSQKLLARDRNSKGMYQIKSLCNDYRKFKIDCIQAEKRPNNVACLRLNYFRNVIDFSSTGGRVQQIYLII